MKVGELVSLIEGSGNSYITLCKRFPAIYNDDIIKQVYDWDKEDLSEYYDNNIISLEIVGGEDSDGEFGQLSILIDNNNNKLLSSKRVNNNMKRFDRFNY